MSTKLHKTSDDVPMTVSEPTVAYRIKPLEISSSDKWNPNVPFHGTQEEWWEHFHRIEEGEFMSIEEADKEFEAWKKKYLASRM